MAFNFEGGTSSDSSSWELEAMTDSASSGIPAEGVERYVSPEIEEWRRKQGISVSTGEKKLDILGGEGGDWLVDTSDKTQVNAAQDLMKGKESEGWSLQ